MIMWLVVTVTITQEADGLVYAYILIWVSKSFGRSATGFEGVFLGFYILREAIRFKVNQRMEGAH